MSKSLPIGELDKLFTEEELTQVEEKSRSLSFSVKLVQLMHQAGKTREQLLEESDLTEKEIQQIEFSGFEISTSLLEKYVFALGGHLRISADMPYGEVKLR